MITYSLTPSASFRLPFQLPPLMVVLTCVNCKQKAHLQALPPPLSGHTCSECGWISNPKGGTLTSSSGKPYYLPGDLEYLSPEERKQRLRMYSRPAPELKLHGAAFWQREHARAATHEQPLRRSLSGGIDLSSVQAHRSQAAIQQQDESERMLQAFRAKGITVSEAAIRRGLMAPMDRAAEELTLPDRSRPQGSLQPSQSVPALPRVSGGAALLARTHSAVEPQPLPGAHPATYPVGSGRGAAAALGRSVGGAAADEAAAGGTGRSSRPGMHFPEEPSAGRGGGAAGASVVAARRSEGKSAPEPASLRRPLTAELVAATVTTRWQRHAREVGLGMGASTSVSALPTRYLRPPPAVVLVGVVAPRTPEAYT